MLSLLRSAHLVGALIFAIVLCQPAPAKACGGCFHPPPQPNESVSLVTDHRMALSVSTTQTVLWDQIRYQGSPSEFAWVLPVGQGARIELARDEWLATLDAVTGPLIAAPPVPCSGFGGGFGGGGCGFGGAESSSYNGGGSYGATDAGFEGNGDVSVISQEVVGPYLAVTIRSSNGEAISQWLLANGFDIPAKIQPILDAYTTQGFDFIALRLAPNVGVQAMQPVRVITPGADPTLPLRMVAAGIGDSVGLTLYVIAEGRYASTNFPNLLLDRSAVAWDPYAQRSTYTALFAETVQKGVGWVTEFSGSPASLSAKYQNICAYQKPVAVPCDASDAGLGDASASDAALDDAGVEDAASEAGDDAAAVHADDAAADGGFADAPESDAMDSDATTTTAPDAGTCVHYVPSCDLFTDYAVATSGMNGYDIRVTRLRTSLPAAALTADLKLGATADQSPLTNLIQTTRYTDPSYNPCPTRAPPPPPPKEGCGCGTAGENHALVSSSLGMVALVGLARRRRRS